MAENARKTVLVVDDEADVRSFLKAALTEAGFSVITASDGFEALEQIEKNVPDLISLDLVMPRKSGVILYRDLARNKAWSKIPIIVVTGHARDDLGKADLKELTMSGPGVYLEKPVRPENYVAAVKSILGMDTTADEKNKSEQVALQNQLKNIIDEADPETLRKLRLMLKDNSSK